ncbi:MAG: hypothetical protein J6S92_09865 [Oscillospiraceae bacterium]|nr:hypothetical protein [Oscillospiraceae bacterium]
MKRTVTRFFSACFAVMLGIGCCTVPANAKVIEPEVVKTDSWTTSYYIDDDVDTLYPYIQCEADIYNDGTIKLYMWNTHEWGGSSPIKQNVTFCQYTRDSSKISDSDFDFYRNLLQGDGFFDGSSVHILNPDAENEAAMKIDRNLHPTAYTIEMNHQLETILGYDTCGNSPIVSLHCQYLWTDPEPQPEQISFSCPSVAIALAKMKVYGHAESDNLLATYRPITEARNTYYFRLFGHDITITPELLSGNIVAEPELTEQERQIKKLEEENKALKNKLQSYEAFDSDGDGFLTSADAQMILVYYAEYLAGATSGKTGDYAAFIQTFKGQ